VKTRRASSPSILRDDALFLSTRPLVSSFPSLRTICVPSQLRTATTARLAGLLVRPAFGDDPRATLAIALLERRTILAATSRKMSSAALEGDENVCDSNYGANSYGNAAAAEKYELELQPDKHHKEHVMSLSATSSRPRVPESVMPPALSRASDSGCR